MFVAETNFNVHVFNLYGDINRASDIMADIFARKPALILTLGAKASYIAKTWTADRQDIPVIFAMVLNWQKYGFLVGQKNMAGITTNIEPGVQFANLSMFAPNVRRIGVIYSKEHSMETINRAKAAADLLGLDLIAKPIRRTKDFQRTFKEMSKDIDAFWIVADPVIYTLNNMTWLAKRCIKEKIVCISQSRNIARQGIMLAIDPDIANIGSQAASMAKRIILKKESPVSIGVQPPLGTSIIVNMKTAREIGVTISETALNMATEIINK